MRTKRLTLQQRKEIFYSLVATQDQGTMTVSDSRQFVIKQFKISDVQLRQIEEEGLDKEWPPLNQAAVSAADVPVIAEVEETEVEAETENESEAEAEPVVG